jgi:hypothetical protein
MLGHGLAWSVAQADVLSPNEANDKLLHMWRMAQGPDVALMNTVELCRLCEIG